MQLLRRAAPFITAAALFIPAVAPAAATPVQQPATPAAQAAAKKAAHKKARARAARAHRRHVARVGRSLMASKALWATVNICDTPGNPNAIGVRASMPGTGGAGRMYMRFRVQFYIPANDSWQWIQSGADSKWVSVGSTSPRSRQSGYTFAFMPPVSGSYALRGIVDYQWRIDGKVAYNTQESTHKGHADAGLGDPLGFSAGLCEIKK